MSQLYKSKIYLLIVSFLIGMLMMSCNGSKNKKTEPLKTETTDKNFIYSELIVNINGDVNDLLVDFKKYELATKKTINKRMGMWLLTYNTDKIAPEKMLEKLKASKYIKEAQFNKNLSERN